SRASRSRSMRLCFAIIIGGSEKEMAPRKPSVEANEVQRNVLRASTNRDHVLTEPLMGRRTRCCVLCVTLLTLSLDTQVTAQQAEIIVPIVQGVYVDADGVLQTVMVGEQGDRLNNLRRGIPIGQELGAASAKTDLRCVSLAQLAREVEAHVRAGTAI